MRADSTGQTHLASRRPCGANAVEIDGRAAPRVLLNLIAHHTHGGGLLDESGDTGHLRGGTGAHGDV